MGSPDSHHWTLPECLVLSVKNPRKHAEVPDAQTGFDPRPVLSVRCSTLTSPYWQHTRRAGSVSGACGQSVRWEFFSEKHSGDFSKLSTGAIENMHFIFSKRREEPKPPLPFTLYLLLKVCQHHHVCTNVCTCVSIFTIIFFEGVKLAH